MKKLKYSRLDIRGLELNIHLGWHESEQQQSQIVLLDVTINFVEPPAACASDHLDDAYCYAKLSALIREKTANQRYRLIEHLSHEIYQIVKPIFKDQAHIGIGITKQPSIPNLRDGVSFYYGDPLT